MPSLQALEEFKSSFSSIGDEQETLAKLELPHDDFPLPGHDPAGSMDAFQVDFDEPLPSAIEPAGDDAENDIFGNLSDLLGGMDTTGDEPASVGQEDIAFGEFIDTIPDDFTANDFTSPEPAAPPDDLATGDFASDDSFNDDFDTAELLKGFSDETAAEQASAEETPFFFDTEEAADNSSDTGFEDMGGLPDFGADESIDFSTDEIPVDEALDFGTEDAADDFAASNTSTDFEDMNLEDFSGFGTGETTELSAEDFSMDETPDFGTEEAADDSSGTGFEDMGGLPDFGADESMDFSGESFSVDETPDFGAEDAGGEAFGDEAFGEDAFDDTNGFDTNAFDTNAFNEESFEEETFNAEAFDEDSFSDTPAMEFSDDEDSFNFGETGSDADNSANLEEITGDSFDNFKIDPAMAEDFSLGGEDTGAFGDGFSGLGDEFSLAGVDSVFDGKSAPASAASSVSPGSAAKAAKTPSKKTDDVEEISLTNEELERFHATLASYPLNLRIACQELIAEHAVDPTKMSRLVKMLISGAPARETATLAGKILDRPIEIPKGFEKKTGEALEAEQSSFGYIFVHNFLPVFRLFILIAMVGLSLLYLGWRFVYTPIRADRIYQYGLEQIAAGNFARANERFWTAFGIHPRVSWFYEYARAFTEARQFTLAEQKYIELLHFTASRNRRNIPEKAAVLEYAHMVSAILGHHERADRILRQNLLDFSPMDREGLLALGDNALAWGEHDPARFEDAREAFATIIELHGRSDPMLERMLKFFIRTDNLGEVLALQAHFMASARRSISSATLAEMGGYFLDKRMEEIRGVPNQFLEHIGGIREILLRAIMQDPMLPESYYHLARYYYYFNNLHDERITLEFALAAFNAAPEGNPRRIESHINSLRRYGEILIRHREFFRAEEYLARGINIYQSALSRRLLTPAPEFGRLFSNMGDLEFFVREGNMQAALNYYRLAEQNGWAPPEIQYRMGVAYYHLSQWGPALERFLAAHREMPLNRRILFALGNASFLRGNYFAAQGFYDQLLGILYADRERLPPIMPSDNQIQLDLVERIMVAQNNLGVTLEALTERTGNNSFSARAQGLYADSARAWDILTRDPETMVRMRPAPGIYAPGVNPAFLNIRNNLNPIPGYEPLFFMRIDMDMFEFSEWETLAPPGYRLSAGVGLAH